MLDGLNKNIHKINFGSLHRKCENEPADCIEQVEANKNDEKKLSLAMDCLAAQGASGIQIRKTSEPVLKSVENLDNNRISASFEINGKIKRVELPKYLYHFTNKDAHEGIQESGVLKASDFKTGRGVYLVDSENFFKHYKDVDVNGEKLDLFLSLVAKTGRSIDDKNLKGYIYQIPTRDLLAKGKLKIRTQEDYFKDQKFIESIDEKIKEETGRTSVISIVGLDHKKARANFVEYVKNSCLMTDEELEKFFENRKKKLDEGYSIFEASDEKLEEKKAIEYIYDNDINLSEFPTAKAVSLPFFEYFSLENETVDYDKFEKLFKEAFEGKKN